MATGDNQLSMRDDELSTSDDQLVDDYLRRLRAAASSLPADRLDELVGDIQAHIAEARASGPSGGSGAHVRNVLERLGQPEDIALAAAQPGSGYASSDPSASSSSGSGSSWSDPAGPGPSGSSSAASGPGVPGGPTGPTGPGGSGTHGQYQAPWAPSPRPRTGPTGLDILAVVLLLLGGLLAGIGWVAGVVLLWASPRWRTSDKLLGTLVWPGGLGLAVLVLFGMLGLAVTAIPCSGGVVVSHAAVIGEPLNTAASCAASGAGWLITALSIAIAVVAVVGPILVAIRLLRQAGRAQAELAAPLGSAA